MTTFTLIANTVLIAPVCGGIVALLGWAIITSRPQPVASRTANRALRRHKAPAGSYRPVSRVSQF
jgi:hypothetical protein